MSDATVMTGEPAAKAARGRGYAGWILFMLVVVHALAVIDRFILGVLTEPIKKELGFSDGQFGALTGLAFGLVYAVSAVPLARVADRRSRPALIAACLTVWSAATVCCGLAGNFIQMFAARIGVGIGEAGVTPATHALIADVFSRERRGTILAIVAAGTPIGISAGVALGGWLFGLVGWRGALIAVAVPGFAVALLMVLTMSDPRSGAAASPPQTPRFGPAVNTLVRTPGLLQIGLGASAVQFALQAMLQWVTPYLMRVHGLTIAQVGGRLGLVLGVAGLLGVMAGGILGDRLLRRHPSGYPLVKGFAMTLAAPVFLALALAPNAGLAFAAIFAAVLLASATAAPAFAAIQNIAPIHMRATASACVGLLVALGIALGPFMVGVASDAAAAWGLEPTLRWALALPAVAAVLAAVLFFQAARRISGQDR